MKFFTVVFTLCFVALAMAEEDYKDAAKYLETCYEELGLTSEHKGEVTDRQNKCGIACLQKALKLMNEDGTINTQTVLENSENLTAEQLDSNIKVCQEGISHDVDPQDYHCELAACLQQNGFI